MHTLVKAIVPLLLIFFVSCSSNKKMTATKDRASGKSFDKQGHRGCRGLMPENTLPAMLKAIDLGVTTLEMDVVFTKDKVAILSHEPFFNHAITTTPEGRYFEEKDERKLNIYQMSFEETQLYDVGLKPHSRFPGQQKLKVTKPSLTSLIDSVENYLTTHSHNKVNYNIETKTNPSTDNLYHPAPAEFVERLVQLIKEKGIENRVVIQSFDCRTLQILHNHFPAIKTAMLIEAFDKRTLDEQLKSLGFVPTIYSPAYSLVNKALIDACHARGIKIIPWTVNEKQQINELRYTGVDGLISDYPNLFNE
jgi:glycerophosphoryl diester phosphodiesterase